MAGPTAKETGPGKGLWAYRNVGFSRAGTLLETLVALVTRAPAGLAVGELEERLQTPVANLLSRLVQHGQRPIQQALEQSRQEMLAPSERKGKQLERALDDGFDRGGKTCKPGVEVIVRCLDNQVYWLRLRGRRGARAA